MLTLYFRYLSVTILLFLAGIATLVAQSLIPGDPMAGTHDEIAANLVQWYNYAMIVSGYVVTYYSRYIPFLKRMDNLAWRAAIITGCLGFLFWKMGAGGLGIAMSFLTLINPYEMVLKPLVGATKSEVQPKESEQAEEITDDSGTEEI